MGDELELLGRMVQGCGAVGGTGEGVRVDDDEAIDTVWACGKSVTEPQYPAKSISSSAAHILRQCPCIPFSLVMRQR